MGGPTTSIVSNGALVGKVDLLLNVPSRDPQRIQESHMTIGHIVCSLVEQIHLGKSSPKVAGKAKSL